MSTLAKYYPNRLEIGTRVRSIEIGSREAFDGVVTGHMNWAYLVTDANGEGWHRERREISVISEAA
ncbi:hypothetical protein [Rhizobium rhizogenes]|uniref:hypothetical protein n=1 Tax=Rhizobium rhizogenes TaxID=359 RepID=UPI001572EEF0|nr:hypothetical protein [Rhizobium rhizogenes]NTF69405.1 hypothetical protein [Rhizobium rhizogenes]